MAYESLLVFGVVFGAALPVVFAWVTVTSHLPHPGNPLFLGYLLLVTFAYFGWCWTRAGQTLAMRAWKVGIEREGGGRPGWREAALRYLGALSSLACALSAAHAAAEARQPGEMQLLAALAGAAPAFAWALFDERAIEDAKVELNSDFLPTQAPAQTLTAMVAAWQAGAVSHDSLWRFLAEGELVDPQRTAEDEAKLIREEKARQPAPPHRSKAFRRARPMSGAAIMAPTGATAPPC